MLIKSQYKINQLISEDILSFLYLGQDTKTSRAVYIWEYKKEFLNPKILSKLDSFLLKLKVINHPNILTILDSNIQNNAFYVINEYLPDLVNLVTLAEENKFIPNELIPSVIDQVMSVMQVIESANLVNGNLNLTSIYLTKEYKVKLTNILLPLLILKPNIDKIKIIDDCIFIPLEFLIKQVFSIRSDLYSFGMLCYFLYAKKCPYTYTPEIDLVKKIALKPFPPLSKISTDIPPRLEQAVNICLSKDPAKRFASFLDMREYLIGKKSLAALQLANLSENNEDNYTIKKLKNIQNNLIQHYYKKTKKYIRYLFLLIPLFCLISFGYYSYVKYTTSIPDAIVPDVIGLTQAQAIAVLKQNHLSSRIMVGYAKPNIPIGCIVETIPPPGREVKQDRQVKLFVAKEEKIELPNFIGSSLEEAKIIAAQDKINLEISGEVFSNLYPKGIIAEQIPTLCPTLNMGDTVKIFVSKGYPVDVIIQPLENTTSIQ